jgi:hypothetical protein
MHHGSAESGADSDLGSGGRLVPLFGHKVRQSLKETTAGGGVLFGACLTTGGLVTDRGFHETQSRSH